ncbi:MAG: HAD family phosphatase [Bacillota bacterium]|nr:HAD family phosphatase [Bacillota bacterium]
MIKNIIFDIGNTLLSFNPMDYLKKEFKNEETVNTLYQTIFKSPEWLSLDRGTISQDEAVMRFCSRQPSLEKEIKHVMGNWSHILIPMEESIKLLSYLKSCGCRIYLLSNFHETAFEYIYNKYSFIKEADGMVISCRVKLLKPEKEIYELLLDKYSLKPEECLFIDDFDKNIEAASELGIHGICFKDAKSVYEYLGKLNEEQAS